MPLLQRGTSGGGGARVSDNLRDSQMKDKTTTTNVRFPLLSSLPTNKADDPYTPRNKQKFMLLFLKTTLALVVLLALAGSFWWTVSIISTTSSSSSTGHVYHRNSYRRLQEQLVF
ncbi:putative pectin methyltransferase QUA2 [Raphanus sativus]|nr:putative pectin methyltransferase QUA2 [Raphanus sativus]